MTTAGAPEEERISLERERLAIEREKLAIERAKLSLEANKTKWTAIGTGLPLLGILATLIVAQINQRRQFERDIEMKAAELVINSKDPDDATGRLRALRQVLPQYATRFRAGVDSVYTYGCPDSVGSTDSSKELLKLIAARPEMADRIKAAWQTSFPCDAWVSTINVK